MELAGKKGLVVGIANENSIASGCACAFRDAGAELAITYLNQKAKQYVEPIAQSVDAPIFTALDVRDDAALQDVFSTIESEWGKLDFMLHSLAYCPSEDLRGRVVDCSRSGFSEAMDVSVYSLLRMAKLAEPLMTDGGAIATVTYYGAEKVVDHYNIMGPVKAALEGAVKYMAAELGSKHIRVNALSPGPLKTRAASGIAHFDEILDEAKARAPENKLITLEEIGDAAVFLMSEKARAITGDIAYIDGGYHVMS